jgi:tetratricopeptide (TPR) repeat protein/ADP-heptose:LPS heptosyltransferase
MDKSDRRQIKKDGIAASGNVAVLCDKGARFRRAGQRLEAIQCCRKALAIDPAHADTLHLMGLLSYDSGEYDHSIAWFAQAIGQAPKPEYLNHLGAALQQLGRLEEALKVFDKAVQLAPENAELWNNLGNVLVQLGRDNEALLSFEHVLTLAPVSFDAASKAAALLHRQERWPEALAHLDLCDRLKPNHAPTLQLRAIAQRGLGNHEAYLADSLRVHALDPDNADSVNNIGDALQSLGREDEAIAWFDKALALLPDNPTVLTNKACVITQFRRLDEAEAIYSRVRTIAPDNALAEWNLALLQMLRGDFAAGWAGREARWRVPALSAHYPKFDKPTLSGEEAIAGKTVLIHIDEGLGDTIQFARYVPMLASRGARVILVVADPMQPLLSKMPGIDQCLPHSARELPPFDLHCALSSLPLVFATRLDAIPADMSYLPRPPGDRVQAWEQRLGPRDRLRIGLVWSGSLTHKNDHNRSIPLKMLSSILELDARFVSLQKDPRPADREMLAARPDIIDFTADLSDFIETAALVSCLDLVITVDTSVAHLAGALERPTWVLLPFVPDYRWLLDRDDSPWYPTVRLFRQDATRDYASVIARTRIALAELISAREPNSSFPPVPAGKFASAPETRN